MLRPWRLLAAVYALPLLLTALWLATADESPKFLMTKGKDKEALKVLTQVYESNTRLPGETFAVSTIYLFINWRLICYNVFLAAFYNYKKNYV